MNIIRPDRERQPGQRILRGIVLSRLFCFLTDIKYFREYSGVKQNNLKKYQNTLHWSEISAMLRYKINEKEEEVAYV